MDDHSALVRLCDRVGFWNDGKKKCSLHSCSSVSVCMSARFGASQDKHSVM